LAHFEARKSDLKVGFDKLRKKHTEISQQFPDNREKTGKKQRKEYAKPP